MILKSRCTCTLARLICYELQQTLFTTAAMGAEVKITAHLLDKSWPNDSKVSQVTLSSKFDMSRIATSTLEYNFSGCRQGAYLLPSNSRRVIYWPKILEVVKE